MTGNVACGSPSGIYNPLFIQIVGPLRIMVEKRQSVSVTPCLW